MFLKSRLACCNTPGCDWVVPSAQGRAGGVVGDDYPHKSDYFNQPGGERGDDPGKDDDQ